MGEWLKLLKLPHVKQHTWEELTSHPIRRWEYKHMCMLITRKKRCSALQQQKSKDLKSAVCIYIQTPTLTSLPCSSVSFLCSSCNAGKEVK